MADTSDSNGSQPHALGFISVSVGSDAVTDSGAQQQEHESSLDLTIPRTPSSAAFSFDGDDLVVEIVAELVEESLKRSLEEFYERRLPGYVSQCAANTIFDVVFALLETPPAKCERLKPGDHEAQPKGNDPVMHVLCQPPSALVEPQPNAIDPFCFYGVPLRSPEESATALLSQLYASYSIPVGMKLQHSGGAGAGNASNDGGHRGCYSRPSSQSSLFRVRKAASTAPLSPRSAAAQANGTPTGEYHAPGVVYSTVSPPRISPRKAMTLLKNAHRVSVTAPAVPGRPDGADGKKSGSGTSSDENESDTNPSGVVPLNGGARGNTKHSHMRDSSSYTSAWGSHNIHEEDDDLETTERPLMEENAPVQVEFAIKRGGERRRSSNKSTPQHPILPELSPQQRLNRNASPSLFPLSELRPGGSLLLATGQDSGYLDPSHKAESKHFSVNAASLQSPLKSLVLAPGVKLQNGDETKVGPELALFPTRMRKATFYVCAHNVSLYIAALDVRRFASRLTDMLLCCVTLQQQDDAIALAASMQSLHSCASFSSRSARPLTPKVASHNQHHLGNNCIEAVVRKAGNLWFNNDNFICLVARSRLLFRAERGISGRLYVPTLSTSPCDR